MPGPVHARRALTVRKTLGVFLIILPFAASPAFAACDHPDGTVAYTVRWGDDRIGKDEIEFRHEENRLIVRTRMQVQASMLFVTVLRMTHESEEVWIDGRFHSFKGRTVDNDDVYEVSIEAADDGFKVVRNGEVTHVPAGFLPGWPRCAEIMEPTGSRVMVDMLKGKTGTVEVRGPKADTVVARGQPVIARHYAMTGGELSREAWFDMDGRFLRARAPAKMGPSITIGPD